tara:strand:- start:4975 stop:10308 length:5334 start_codon:yes stop_codon:yes gene_type:complete
MGNFNKGLVKDTTHHHQPENTYNHALNAILKEKVGSICTEGGVLPLTVSLASGDINLIGKVRYRDIYIVFLKYIISGDCVIAKFENDIFTEVFRSNAMVTGALIDADLKFSSYNLIKGEANIDNQGDLNVYWIDDINYPRTLNIDKQLRSIVISGNTTFLYGIDPAATIDKNYIDKLRLFPHSGPIPKIDATSVLDGGSLEIGAYSLNLSYEDEDGSRTGNLTTSLPVALSMDNVGVITGSPSINTDTTAPIIAGKTIQWSISNINIEQEYILPYIVVDKGKEERTAVKLPKIKISEFVNLTARTVTITFEGSEGEFGVSLSEVYDVKFPYKTAKAIEQFKDRLYLGNLTVDPILRYQKYANAIKLKPKVKSICDFDRPVESYQPGSLPWQEYYWGDGDWVNYPNTPDIDNVNTRNETLASAKINSYKNPDYYVNYRGYKRGEVYSFYIAFVLSDGTLSPAYHIPGRDVTTDNPIIVEKDSVADAEVQGIMDYDIKNYELYDTSTNIGSNFMGYWENKDELYPGTTDWDTTDYSLGSPFIGPSLQTTNVRHHRFPDTQAIDDPAGGGGYVPYAYNVIQDPSMECAVSAQNVTNTGGALACSPGLITSGAYGNGDTDNSLIYIDSTGSLPHGILTGVGDATALIPGLPIVGEWVSVTWQYSNNGSWTTVILPVISVVVGGTGVPPGGFVVELGIPANYSPGYGPYIPIAHLMSTSITWSGGTYSQTGTGCDVVPCTTDPADEEQSVSILGFTLDNLYIPDTIADKIQGFRIYRSKRRDEDKTTMGQGAVTRMAQANKMGGVGEKNWGVSSYFSIPLRTGDWGNCTGGVTSTSGGGFGCMSGRAFAFSNQYLLRTNKPLTSATHIKLLTQSYSEDDEIHGFYGPHANYPISSGWAFDDDPGAYGGSDNSSPMALASIFSFTRFYNVFPEDIESYAKIKGDACKRIQGNTITNIDDDGFSKDFDFNMGSESHIALEIESVKTNFKTDSGQAFDVDQGYDTPGYNSVSGSGYTLYLSSTSGYNTWTWPYWKVYTNLGQGGGLRTSNDPAHSIKIVDIRSFKRNVYNSFDTMDLVWTGYEVLGYELDRFVVEEDTGAALGINVNDLSGLPNFTTGNIFGGDTFINRYWWRVTHDGMDTNKNEPDFTVSGMNSSTTLTTNMPTGSQRGLFSVILESEDNIDLRHSINAATAFYPERSVKDILYDIDGICTGLGITAKITGFPTTPPPDYLPVEPCLITDLTNHETGMNAQMEEGIRYNTIYSSECDLGGTVPIIKDFKEILAYPTRVIRSLEPTGIANTYRNYPEFDYLDVDIHRGPITNIFSLMDNIMIQTESSIFSTRGNETMSLETGGNVFIGTGNVFEMPPKEFVDTELGSGGTPLRYSALSLAAGRLYIDYDKRRIFLITVVKDKKTGSATEGVTDLTVGMENWFTANIPFKIWTLYGMTNIDLPYSGIGFHTTYDQTNKRVLITKVDFTPTTAFLSDFSSSPVVTCTTGEGTIRLAPDKNGFQIWHEDSSTYDCGWYVLDWHDTDYFYKAGWTISYQLDLKVWASFHSYTPNMYLYTTNSYYGVLSGVYDSTAASSLLIFKHNNYAAIGAYYQLLTTTTTEPFEVEYTTNGKSDATKQFYAIEVNDVVTDIGGGWFTDEGPEASDNRKIQDIGFSSFYVYNRLQISGEVPLVPLTPTVSGSGNYRSAGSIWTINNFRDETLLTATYAGGLPSYPSPGVSMFTANGNINTNYIDPTKTWDERPKFVDKYLNIRLICDNLDGNFVTLLSSTAKFRPYFR